MIDFKRELNPQQYEAVTTIEGPLLIIAGAGSGKTRVITFRIARMLEKGVPQNKILALTFTNKAANEMATRVRELTGRKLQALTVSTFHSFGVQVLRAHCQKLGWRQNFSIYDEQDKIQLIKDSARELKMNVDDMQFYEIAQLFSNIKIGRFSWQQVGAQLKPLYDEYQRGLRIFNAVDFDDLITLPIEILKKNDDVRNAYRERFSYIMVDEFQDTSVQQYEFMRILAGRNVAVVGDDDQSIYSWRGANYENIRMFERDFPDVKEIKLEQNYRSTETILAAANGVISHNTNRKDKSLWSGNGAGKAIEIYSLENSSAEADFVANSIRTISATERLSYDDFGVLVRANKLTREIEEAFLAKNLPYTIAGGDSFYKKNEIKDIAAYLHVCANFDDDIALMRIINTPRRGIGRKSLEDLTKIAAKNECSLWSAINACLFKKKSAEISLFGDETNDDDYFSDEENFEKFKKLDTLGISLGEKADAELENFVNLILRNRNSLLREKPLSAKVRNLIDEINYRDYLLMENSKNEKLLKYKLHNMEYFVELIETWERDNEGLNCGLFEFLNRISLFSRDENSDDSIRGKVNLMTIHAAKGLEFPVVFIVGCEDGIIPSARSIEENETNIEEERRLFYVAITRAKSKLCISHCKKRNNRNQETECEISPFVAEIPENLVEFCEKEPDIDEEKIDAAFAALKERFAKKK